MTFEIKKGELTDREQKTILKMLKEGRNWARDEFKNEYKNVDYSKGVRSFKIGLKLPEKDNKKPFDYRLVKVYFNSKKSA